MLQILLAGWSDALAGFFAAVGRFFGGAFGATAGRATLFLVVGGLFLLAFVTLLIQLRGVFPKRESKKEPEGPVRSLRRTPSLEDEPTPLKTPVEFDETDLRASRTQGRELAGATLEESFLRLVENGHGEPRVVRVLDDRSVVRFYECPGCARGGEEGACGHAAGLLAGLFEKLWEVHPRIREVACRRQGAPVCDFEVLQ